MKTEFQEFDLTFKATDCIIPPSEADLAKEKDGGSVKRRVVAITEGKWNNTVFRPEEIDQVPANTEKRRGRDQKNGTYNVPLVLDHSDDFLKRVGDTFNIQTGTVKGKNGEETHGLILDHEFRQLTTVQKDTIACVKDKPEETFFSIRARGKLEYDEILKEDYWTELSIEHDSIVTDPACPNTGIVGELSKSDPPLNTVSQNPSGMENGDMEKRFSDLEQSVSKITTHIEKQIADQAARDQAAAQEDVLERADTIAEIFALDPEVNRTFLKTLSKDQLKDYKTDLARRQQKEGETPDGKGQAGSTGTAALSLDDKAKKFLEG